MIDAPYGRAHWRSDNARDVVCVAGGSGVGPIASIVQAALSDGRAREIHVFEGARTEADLCFRKLVPDETPALVYAPALSAEAGGRAPGRARAASSMRMSRRTPFRSKPPNSTSPVPRPWSRR